MQYSVLQFPLLQHLAGMLGHGKRHRGLQSRPLRSGATLPAVGRTPWLTARSVARVRNTFSAVHRLQLAARSGAISLVRPVARVTVAAEVHRPLDGSTALPIDRIP